MSNVRSTAEIIISFADELEATSGNLRRTAEKMIEREDFDYAADAMMTITNLFSNLRLDLLVTRPIRELEREFSQHD